MLYCSPECRKTRSTAKAREKRLLDLYGITPAEYDAILEKQGNVCAICKQPFKAGRSPAVDHDHVTGTTRGILCWWCNHHLLPASKDNPVLLKNAYEYLMVPPAVAVLGIRVGDRAITKSNPRKRRKRKRKKLNP